MTARECEGEIYIAYLSTPGCRAMPPEQEIVAIIEKHMARREARLVEALEWYEANVKDCNRFGKEGDEARDRLAKDHGQKATQALTHKEER